MGLFSFLFPKNNIIRSTHEAETLREVFRDNNEIFTKVEDGDDLKHLLELEECVNSPEFRNRRKEIEQLTYKGSEYLRAEKQYKTLLKSEKLRSFYLIKDSEELKGYEQIQKTDLFQSYLKLRVVVTAPGFDKKLQAGEYVAYQECIRNPKIAAAIRFEKNRKYKNYLEVKGSKLLQEFEQLTAYVKSDEFKNKRAFLINKKRYLTTEDYKLLCEYEALKHRPDIAKFFSLRDDIYFNELRKWELVFRDDFNTGKLDEGKWIARYYAGERFLNDTYGVGKDVQLFTSDNISHTENSVCLNFRKESIIGKYWDSNFGIKEKKYDYTSAILSTATSFRQRYGKFEAKIKLQHCAINQCFWMSADSDVPHVDILKSDAEGTYAGNVYPCHGKCNSTTQLLKDLKLTSGFYIFTLEWTVDKLVWKVNDVVVKEVRENIPDVPMYINFSLGATNMPGERCLPCRMEIEWVKIYKMKN